MNVYSTSVASALNELRISLTADRKYIIIVDRGTPHIYGRRRIIHSTIGFLKLNENDQIRRYCRTQLRNTEKLVETRMHTMAMAHSRMCLLTEVNICRSILHIPQAENTYVLSAINWRQNRCSCQPTRTIYCHQTDENRYRQSKLHLIIQCVDIESTKSKFIFTHNMFGSTVLTVPQHFAHNDNRFACLAGGSWTNEIPSSITVALIKSEYIPRPKPYDTVQRLEAIGWHGNSTREIVASLPTHPEYPSN